MCRHNNKATMGTNPNSKEMGKSRQKYPNKNKDLAKSPSSKTGLPSDPVNKKTIRITTRAVSFYFQLVIFLLL